MSDLPKTKFMKKIYLIIIILSTALSSYAQSGDTATITTCGLYTANDGSVYTASAIIPDTIVIANDSSFYTNLTINALVDPVINVSAAQCAPNAQYTLTGTSILQNINSFRWYDSNVGGNLLHVGPVFEPSLSQNTSFYVNQAGITAQMPAQTGILATGSNTTGYWFIAPSAFVITSLFVPTTDSSQFQNIAVLKMDGNINPPTAALSTNDFSTLYLTQVNNTRGSIAVNIPIQAGEVIGILGSRELAMSLSNAGNIVVVDGQNITLNSFAFPGQLTTTAPYNVSSFPANPNIGRVLFEYTTLNSCINPARTRVDVVVNPTFLDTMEVIACDSFTSISGDFYNYSTSYYDTLQTSLGCDSVIYVDLKVYLSSLDSIVVEACDSFVAPSGASYFATAMFYDTTYYPISSCNNIKYIDLTVNDSKVDTAVITVCDTYTSPKGVVLTTDTFYSELIQTLAGCDSLLYIDLTVNYKITTIDSVHSCDTYTSLSGNLYTADTMYYDTLSTVFGCDSFVLVYLDMDYSTLDSMQVVACDSYTSLGGNFYTSSASFYDTLTTTMGCDSVIFTDLTINYSNFQILEVETCDTYTSPAGDVYTASTSFTDVLVNALGCDSIIQVELIIYYSTSESIYPIVCDTYVSPAGNTYTSNSIFTDILTTADGCDSIIHVFLTVRKSKTTNLNIIACSSYTSPLGVVYTNSAQISDTLATAFACDSVVNINLTIVNGSTQNLQVEVCDSYISPAGDLYTNSQTFSDTLSSSFGCDSIINVALTIYQTTYDTIHPSVCVEFVSDLDNVYIYQGVYTEYYTSKNNCDSILIIDLEVNPINLTINKLDELLESLEFGATYQWYDCLANTAVASETARQFISPDNGVYSVIIDNGSCVDTSACVDVNSVGINDFLLNGEVLLAYPNPAKDLLYLSSEANLEAYEFRIFDLQGKLLQQGQLQAAKNTIDISTLKAGVYFLQVDELSIPLIKLD